MGKTEINLKPDEILEPYGSHSNFVGVRVILPSREYVKVELYSDTEFSINWSSELGAKEAAQLLEVAYGETLVGYEAWTEADITKHFSADTILEENEDIIRVLAEPGAADVQYAWRIVGIEDGPRSQLGFFRWDRLELPPEATEFMDTTSSPHIRPRIDYLSQSLLALVSGLA